MSRLLRFLSLSVIKILGQMFYSYDVSWTADSRGNSFANLRLIAILNHTSLIEPIFAGILPFRFLWELAGYATFPIADITMRRPLVSRFFKLLVPGVVSITRARDDTWTHFMKSLDPDAIVMIFPEGRMKRPDGFDKDGKPMTVRGGIADILAALSQSNTNKGDLLLAYSGGLHHVHAPGERFPRLFKRIAMRFERFPISDYLGQLGETDDLRVFKLAVVKDLEARRDKYT